MNNNIMNISEYRKYYRKCVNAKLYDMRINPVSRYLDLSREPVLFSGDFCVNHPNRILSSIRQNESGEIYVMEGLQKTYPMRKLVDSYRIWYMQNISMDLRDFRLSDITYRHYATDELEKFYDEKLVDVADLNIYFKGDQQIVTFYFPFRTKSEYENLLKSACDSLYRCGYNLASNEIIKFDDEYLKTKDVSVAYMTFEPKFSDLDFRFADFLYHIAPASLIGKIKANGIVPKSKHSFFKYPDRAYLFNDCDMSLILDYGLGKCDDIGKKEFILLRIDSRKLTSCDLYKSGKLVFYVDQKYPSFDEKSPVALYTYNNIPLSVIDDEFMRFMTSSGRIIGKTRCSLSEL